MAAIRQASVGQRRSACARGASGFTLIEVLVVIGIIAVLIGILAPALSLARDSARNTVCLSNLHQIGVAWAAYSVERKVFPAGGGINPQTHRYEDFHLMVSWGGVDFQAAARQAAEAAAAAGDPNAPQNPGGWVAGERPLNSYLGCDGDSLLARSEVFRCPNDDGLRWSGDLGRNQNYYTTNTANWYLSTEAQDIRDTVYGQQGTSYRANDWIWAPIGYPYGHFDNRYPGNRHYVANNRPEWVLRPSNFVVVGDHGPFWIMRADEVGRKQYYGCWYSWWHGKEKCNVTFLDGAAKQVTSSPGDGACNEWSFWLDERQHQPKSWIAAFGQGGTPRERMP